MIGRILSCGISGIDGKLVTIDVDASAGLPAYDTVGLPDKAVAESRERIRAALRNNGFILPPRRITVNLAPADLKKEGAVYDLPIALGLLAACDMIEPVEIKNSMVVGELALDGAVRPIYGALSMAITAKANQIKRIFCPEENALEAAYIDGIEVIAVKSLEHICNMLKRSEPFAIQKPELFRAMTEDGMNDFSLIKGQHTAKRAAEIAAAGGHNMLMVGTPGGGKTMLARSFPTILPQLNLEEALEITRIYSAAGKVHEKPLVRSRPFCSPHHTASAVSLIGGTANAKPGEISMSHLGVLFLDEIPEFSKEVLESLRQPLEDGFITVTRTKISHEYPADFMLIAAMNPCPCGYFGSKTQVCTCKPHDIIRYRNRLSGPLIDRIDIFIRMDEVKFNDFYGTKQNKTESSADIRLRADRCREIQRRRFAGQPIHCNAQMKSREITHFCKLDSTTQEFYRSVFEKQNMTGRAHSRALKLARTIADLDESENIQEIHLLEALQYRSMHDIWG